MPVTEPETPKALLADGYERCVEVLCAECMFVAFYVYVKVLGTETYLGAVLY